MDKPLPSPYDVFKSNILSTDMELYVVVVDEPMARTLLELYNREPKPGEKGTNRKASQVRINEYCATMLADEWVLSPQPLIFSVKNKAGIEEQEDGQQRLKALIQAARTRPDIAIPFTIIIEAPLEANMVLDRGKPRSLGDYLKMNGETYADNLSNTSKLVYAYFEVDYTGPDSWRKLRYSNQMQAAYLAEHPGLRQALTIARDIRMKLPQPTAAACWYIFSQEYGPFVASEFLQGLEKGLHMSGDDSRYRLREYLSRQKELRRKWEPFERLALCIKAANAWLIGDEDFKPYFRSNERFPQLWSREKVNELVRGDTSLPEEKKRYFLEFKELTSAD